MNTHENTLKTIQSEISSANKIAIVVGAEGGFSDEEKKQLRGFLKKNRSILHLSGNVLFQSKQELRKAVNKVKKRK